MTTLKAARHVEPMGYGIGKSGWVSVKKPKGAAPMDMFEEWIDESYANVAPKRRPVASKPPSKAPPRSRESVRARG